MKEINDDYVFNNDDSTLPGFDPDSITSLPGMNGEEGDFEMPGLNDVGEEKANNVQNVQNVQNDINIQNGTLNDQIPQFDPYANMMNQESVYQDPNMNMNMDMMNQNNGYQDQNLNQNLNQDLNQNFNMMNQDNSYQENVYQDPNMNMNMDMMNQNYGYQDLNQAQEQNQNQNQSLNQDYNMMNQENVYQDPNMNMNMNNDINQNYGYQDQSLNQDFNQNFNQDYNQDYNMMNQNYGYQDLNQAQEQNQNQNQSFNQDFNQDYNMMNQNNYQYQSNDSDGSFAQAWMGSLYEKARTKKFNWCAAFFGPIYMLFRKMFTTGLLLLILQMALVVVAQLIMKTSTIGGIVMNAILPVLYFITFGFIFYPLYNGFVKGQEEKYSKLIKNQNQLNAIANKKGGTSALGIILAVVLYSVFSTVLMFSGLIKVGETNNNEVKTNNTINNVVEETTEKFNFDDKYAFEYDSSKWFLDEDKKQIKNGDYTLVYKGKYTAEALNMDMSSLEGLNKLLGILQTSFTNQAAQMNFQVEKGSNNFTKQNDNYYAYLDIIDSTSISRYYFVVIPNDGVLFQFVLTTEDTTINYQFNVDVIDMITNIVDVNEEETENNNENSNEVNGNQLTNTTRSVLSNEVSDNSVNTNSANNTNSTNSVNSTNSTNTTNTVANESATNTTNTTRVLTTTNTTQNRNLNSFLN